MVSLLLSHPKLSISHFKFYLFFLSNLNLSSLYKNYMAEFQTSSISNLCRHHRQWLHLLQHIDPNSLSPSLSLLDLSDLNEWSFLAPPQKTLATTTIRVASQLQILTFTLSKLEPKATLSNP